MSCRPWFQDKVLEVKQRFLSLAKKIAFHTLKTSIGLKSWGPWIDRSCRQRKIDTWITMAAKKSSHNTAATTDRPTMKTTQQWPKYTTDPFHSTNKRAASQKLVRAFSEVSCVTHPELQSWPERGRRWNSKYQIWGLKTTRIPRQTRTACRHLWEEIDLF